MSFDLENFESFVDSKIEQRGYNYFAGGAVEYLEEVRTGLWRADVEGNRMYQVQVKLDQQTIEYTTCDCPYDFGAICKHIVAVLYTLRAKLLREEVHTEIAETESEKEKAGSKTVAQQIEEILDRLPPEQIQGFLQEMLENDRRLRSVFMSRFSTVDEMQGTSGIRNQVKSILAPVKRQGLVYAGEARSYLMGVQKLIQKAERKVVQRNTSPATTMCMVIIEELVSALRYIDDSSGEVGSLIEWSFDILYQAAGQDLEESVRKNFFNECLKQSEVKEYKGWYYDRRFMDLAVELTGTPEEIELLEQQLTERMEQSRQPKQTGLMYSGDDTYVDTYSVEQYARQLLQLYEKSGQEAKYQELLQQNRDLPGIMQQLIGQAWQQQEYEAVRNLSNEALKKFDDKPGLNKQWIGWLLKVAEAEQNIGQQREYTRRLLLDTRSMDWYKKLKKLYPKEEWAAVSEKLLKSFEGQKSLWSTIYADICVEEERWKQLLEYVRKQPRFSTLQHYDSWLKDHYFDELMELYKTRLLEFMKQNTGRNYYRQACQILHRMQILGGIDTVSKVADIFQRDYSNRPALQDELRKAGFA